MVKLRRKEERMIYKTLQRKLKLAQQTRYLDNEGN
jgi:hypothetical protein